MFRFAVVPLCLLLTYALLGQGTHTKKAPSATTLSKPTDESEMRFRFRLQYDPHDKNAHKQLQKLLGDKYAFRAQLVEYASWLKNNPDDYETELEMRSLATAAVDDPEFAIAEDRFVLAHANRSLDSDSYDSVEERMAFLLLKRGKYEEALKLLKHQTQVRATDAAAWEDLGSAEVQADNPRAAIEAYRESINLDGNQEDPHAGLGEAFLKLKDFHHAETELIAAIAIYNSQYHGAATSDSFHEMMKKLQEATNREPELSALHRHLAMVYSAEGNTDKAIAEIDAALKATSDEYSDYFLKASLYETAGQSSKAVATLQQAHIAFQRLFAEINKEEHGSTEMAEYLAEFSNPDLLFLLNEDDNDSLAPAMIAFLEPQLASGKLKPMERLMIGKAYCTVGRISDCRREEETAFRLESKLSNGKSEHTLGLALLAGKDITGAKNHLQRAYELDPQNVTYRMDYEQMP